MAGEWPRVRLAEAVDFLAGFAFKSEFYAEEDLGPRLCLGANVAPGAPDWSKLRYWPRAMCEGVERYFLADGDVVLAMDRPWIPGGLKVFRFAEVDGPALLVQRVARLRGTSLLDSGYLHAVLRHPAFTDYILGVQTGTTVPHISAGQILGYEIDFPPMSEQRRIAAILGALDDKIELNRKMNRTLEEMAQALFKSWFIDFDGHDDLVDSEIGPVPRGWEVGGPDAVVEFDPSIPLRKGTEAVYADMKAIPTSGPAVSEWTRRPYAGGTRFQQGDTLLARITPCLENGKSALVDFLASGEVAFGSTEFIVLRPRPGVPRVWPYCLVRHEPFRAHAIANMTGSSGRQRVSSSALMGFQMAVPSAGVLQRFGEATNPLFARITANTREATTLAAVRDSLLPKLISGELRVPDAKAAISEAS